MDIQYIWRYAITFLLLYLQAHPVSLEMLQDPDWQVTLGDVVLQILHWEPTLLE